MISVRDDDERHSVASLIIGVVVALSFFSAFLGFLVLVWVLILERTNVIRLTTSIPQSAKHLRSLNSPVNLLLDNLN